MTLKLVLFKKHLARVVCHLLRKTFGVIAEVNYAITHLYIDLLGSC